MARADDTTGTIAAERDGAQSAKFVEKAADFVDDDPQLSVAG